MRRNISDKKKRSPEPNLKPMEHVEIPFLLTTIPSSNGCTRCEGTGYVRVDVPYGDPAFGKAIPCHCTKAERDKKRLQSLRGISRLEALGDKNFQNFFPRIPGMPKVFLTAEQFAQDPDGWLVFLGGHGCGKTHLAAAIANARLDRGSQVLFMTVSDLLDHLRATFAPTSTMLYDQLFSRLREAELLVLDDLGAVQSSPWAGGKLFQLLDYRYTYRLPTIITADQQVLQTVDERIRSRLMDKSVVTQVTFDGIRDYRLYLPPKNSV
jgi:DNA replication protein DnaC